MELKITDERVRAAAAKCSQAKDVLTELFPEAFERAFKPGDVVSAKDCKDARFVVVNVDVSDAFHKAWHWGAPTNHVHLVCIKGVGFTLGGAYTKPASELMIVGYGN